MKTYPENRDFSDAGSAASYAHEYQTDARPFCPVIKGLCDHNCLCYVASSVKEFTTSKWEGAAYVSTKIWRFYSEHCSNPMLTRDRQVES